ncbi:hypothetical protein AC792_11770 [Arthrobacter sp. RIT-PI-e]|nr:hypothetical protein AC792_11770 [Arthrobacter sp. RIT-PI-e]
MVLPGQQTLGGRPRFHGQLRAHRDGVTQSHRPLGGRHADPPVALPPEQLRALPGGVAEVQEHRPRGGDQPVLAGGGGQFHQAATEDEAALDVPAHQAGVGEGEGEAVHGGAGESRGGHQLRQGGGAGFQGIEYQCGLVDHADAARIVHRMILQSHHVRRKPLGWHRQPGAG